MNTSLLAKDRFLLRSIPARRWRRDAAHSHWKLSWPVLVTILGWCLIAALR